MNPHLRRGLVAGSIAFGLVALAGALNIYFDPPIDVPAVGYHALVWLVKAVLGISAGMGLIAFVLFGLGSAIVCNFGKRWIKLVILGGIAVFGSMFLYLSQPPKHPSYNHEKHFINKSP